ncbi:MAG: 1-acyl-sn-glycerol-3-phosphate acyltransferase [Candidatus Latescibacterota bacterium]|nr:MAG: 1-acyl-sn-glycerol-3-phosphate acyltransferase [Candidatus Latescibacterota bacterium]
MNLRGCLTMLVLGVLFLAADIAERTVIIAIIKLRPSSRSAVLNGWLIGLCSLAFWVIRLIGGARFDFCEPIRCEPGILVVMNHQSLLDIPIALRCMTGGYPKIIARDRYRTSIPLISHMIRLYDHPTVKPGQRNSKEMQKLQGFAKTTVHPVVIYPEGSRSRDGDIKPFRTAGLKAILAARAWNVYVIVIDGLWKSTSLGGFVRNVSSMRVTVKREGPLEFDSDRDDPNVFVDDLEHRMRRMLDRIRGRSTNPECHPGVQEKAS